MDCGSMKHKTMLIVFLLAAMLEICITEDTDPSNLLENGSFELGNYDNSSTNSDYEIVFSPSSAISGWFLQNGSVDWAKGRWQSSTDGSFSCIDLSGGGPGQITTTFKTTANTTYTVLLDAAANPDASNPVTGTFSLSLQTVVSSRRNRTNSSSVSTSSSLIVLNSSIISVNGRGYSPQKVGWRTSWVIFHTSDAGYVNLTLASQINGFYGPLIDHVRVYKGIHHPSSLPAPVKSKKSGSKKDPLIAGLTGSATAIAIFILGVFIWSKKRSTVSISCQDKEGIQGLQEQVTIYPYHLLKAATKNFHPSCKLGQGGFGAVFKGVLSDGTEVAVKKLSAKSFQGQREFLNEISLISHVQHRNLVVLKGCCVKRKEKLLVYEFLENRSLFQALLDTRSSIFLDWPTRMKIVTGTARGLAYLHEDSRARIVHRDIKASNILLDRNLNPKIADFGLAKFFLDDQTHITTRVAGTIGYVAPEYAMRGHLTEKADVFSFGIVALEVVSGKANMDPAIPINTVYILDWASILLNEDKLLDLVDPKLGDDYCVAEVLRVIQVALLCTQGLAAARPSMSLVVSMLLGEASIQGLHKRNSEYSIEKISSNTSQTTSFYFHSYDSSTTPSNIRTTDTHLSQS
eukprot:Gb_25562 [translate_table: standard]